MKTYSKQTIELCKNSAMSLSKTPPEKLGTLLEETSFLQPINPSFTIRKYCIENNIHSIPLCETCGNHASINAANAKKGFNKFCSMDCRKNADKLDKDVLDKLSNKEWLYEQRITLQKSKDTIAEELGISITPVNKWIKIHGIDHVKYNKNNTDMSNTLGNKEWLYEQYVTNGLGLRDIAAMCNCGTGIVTNFMNFHEIKRRNVSEVLLTEDALCKLNDAEWLKNMYVLEHNSLETISAALNCSPCTVSNYLKSFNISLKTSSESKLSVDAYKLLNNYDWLYEKYVSDHLTLRNIAELLGCSDTCVGRYISKCGIEIRKEGVSSQEYKIRTFLDSIGVEYMSSVKTMITPYELDIYIPSSNIAIEINGVHWHSELYKPNSYHKMKYDMCKSMGIRLVHLYEDDINMRFDIIKRLLMNMLNKCNDQRVFARKCQVIHDIDHSQLVNFFDTHHIQGYVNHSTNICLQYDNEIVAAMLFTGNQLVRYTTSKKIIGGLTKLTKHSKLDTIYTFLDIQMFDGSSYINNGFKIIDHIKPDYRYVYADKRMHKFNFRKSRFKNDPKLEYITGATEHELALMNKIYRIYDCGKLKLVWHRA